MSAFIVLTSACPLGPEVPADSVVLRSADVVSIYGNDQTDRSNYTVVQVRGMRGYAKVLEKPHEIHSLLNGGCGNTWLREKVQSDMAEYYAKREADFQERRRRGLSGSL